MMKEEDLFDAYLRQELSVNDSQELLQLLEADENAKKRFVEYTQDTSLFIKTAKDLQHSRNDIALERQSTRTSVKFLLAVAAIIVVAFIIKLPLAEGASRHTYVVKGSSDLMGNTIVVANEMFTLGANEAVEFQNLSGTRIICSGPLQMSFISDKEIYVEQGKVTVFLEAQDKGFLLKAPFTQVEDIGTAFACEISKDELQVHVLEGVVKLDDKLLVNKEEAYAINSLREISKVQFDGGRFIKEVQSGKARAMDEILLLNGEKFLLNVGKSVASFKARISANVDKHETEVIKLHIYADGRKVKTITFSGEFPQAEFEVNDLSDVKKLQFQLRASVRHGKVSAVMSEIHFDGRQSIKFPEEIVSVGSAWTYYKGATPPSADWFSMKAHPSTWQYAMASFGYGDEVRTEIAKDKHPLFLRKTFSLDKAPGSSASIILSTIVDDGAVFYLNGKEIYRVNVGDGPVSQISRAVKRTRSEGRFETIELRGDFLQKGENLISVVVYQFHGVSSDMHFDLKLVLDDQP